MTALGYHPPVGWDVEAFDWDAERPVPRSSRPIVDGTLARGDGAMVLLHTWPTPTIDALPDIVRRLRDAGAELVRLDQLPTTDGPPRTGGV